MSIVEAADGAIEAHGDAMRWSPEPDSPLAADQREEIARVHAYFEELAEGLAAAFRVAAPAFAKIGRDLREACAFIERAHDLRHARLSRMHTAYRRRRR